MQSRKSSTKCNRQIRKCSICLDNIIVEYFLIYVNNKVDFFASELCGNKKLSVCRH